MLVRDARGVQHNLGPSLHFQPSMMKMIGSASTGSGGWTTHKGLFDGPKRERKVTTVADHRAYNRAHREANLEHYRELERATAQRYRERKHGHAGQHCVHAHGPRSHCILRVA